MEQLNRLIKDASNQFSCHNFQTALSLYVRCIKKCEDDELPKYVLHNLKTSEAALRTILGELQVALKILNEILEDDKQHWLSLLRRSQVFKKQGKFKKGLKDLETLSMYAPDNMQVAALKLELKGLMAKTSGSSSQSQQDSGEEEADEEQLLKFSALKKIDRMSVSIMLPKGRQSRVTLSGDSAFFYQCEENGQNEPRQSDIYTPHFIRQKFIDIDKQLEETSQSETNNVPVPVIKAKPSIRTKSILRNRDSKIYVSEKCENSSQEQGRKLIDKLQNVEGKVISTSSIVIDESSNSNSNENERRNSREVGFRKSLFASEECYKTVEQSGEECPVKVVKKKAAGRKSCLKRSSFTLENEQNENKKGPRRSKFEEMSRSSIDGKVIKSEKRKKAKDLEASKENIGNASDNQSEQGSQFNIFGSKKLNLTQQMRANLGISEDSIVEDSKPKKKQRGKSILKKNSILISNPKDKKKPHSPKKEKLKKV